MVNIKMPKHYWDVFNRALNVIKSFCNLDFEHSFELLFLNGFKNKEKLINVKENSNKIKEILFDGKMVVKNNDFILELEKWITCFENEDGDYDLTPKELSSISRNLDFVIRIWLGQWHNFQDLLWICRNEEGEPLSSVFYMPYNQDHMITACRNRMLPIFVREGICNPGVSFGIYSEILHDDIRILYGIYKALEFAVTGNPSDRDIVRYHDVPVSIKFPYKEEFTVSTYAETKKWLDEHPVPGFINDTKKSYVEEEKTKELYVYLNDMQSILVCKGDKIFVCENNFLEVEKDGKLYTYNYNMLSKKEV